MKKPSSGFLARKDLAMNLRLRRVLLLTIASAVVCLTAAFADLHTISNERKEEPAWQAMERVNAEVLAIYENEDLRTTEITVGFRLGSEEDAQLVDLSKVQFADRNGARSLNLSVNSFWYSEESNFAIALIRSDAAIKPSALKYRLFSSEGDVTYEGILRNEVFGFSDYKALDAADGEGSLFLELNGCHYITVARWHSDTGIQEAGNSMVIYDTVSYALVPLEKEIVKIQMGDSLYWTVRTSEDLPDNLSVVVSASSDEADPAGQIEIQIKAEILIPGSVYRSDAFDEAVFHLINQEAIRSSEVILTDAEGNPEVLPN